MIENKLGVTTDCVCDLPQEILDEYSIELIPFNIVTERGRFCDFSEITSDNVLEYIADGHKAVSMPMDVGEYKHFFEKCLKKYDKILHISITSGMSLGYKNACEAAKEFDGRVTVFDSLHLSTGMGHIVIKAARLAGEDKTVEEIVPELAEMRARVSTSFIAYSADYLYINGKIKKSTASFCKTFGIHPILSLNKEGRMVLGGIQVGNYDKAAKRYIKSKLKKHKNIDGSCIFITHAGCSTKMIEMVKGMVKNYNFAEKIEITNASATVSSNCGPNAFGVLFVCKK